MGEQDNCAIPTLQQHDAQPRRPLQPRSSASPLVFLNIAQFDVCSSSSGSSTTFPHHLLEPDDLRLRFLHWLRCLEGNDNIASSKFEHVCERTEIRFIEQQQNFSVLHWSKRHWHSCDKRVY